MTSVAGKIWLSADQHFEHTNIIKYCERPFETTEEMARVIMLPYRDGRIEKDDVLYWLGDVFFTKTLPDYVNGLPETFLIRGNHDRALPESYHSAGIIEAGRSMGIDYRGEKILLVHDPAKILNADKRVRKHFQNGLRWTWADPFIWQLAQELPCKVFCGHVHGLFRRLGQFVNVGVDVWNFRPITIEEALEAYDDPVIPDKIIEKRHQNV